MTVQLVWTNPGAGGSMDLSTGNVLPESWVDAVASNFLVLGGTAAGLHTGNLQVTGNLSVGAAVSTINGLFVVPAALTGVVQTGVFSNVAGTAAGTTEIAGFSAYAFPSVAMTVATAVGFHALNPAKASGATVTNDVGFLAETLNQGFNNYGVMVLPPSGGAGNNFGIYVLGGSPGIYVGAGGLTVAAGLTQLVGNLQAGPPGANYASTGAARFASAQAICWRNNANSGDIVFGPDSGDRMVFSGGLATTTSVGAAGGASAMPTPAAYWPINVNGTAYRISLFN